MTTQTSTESTKNPYQKMLKIAIWAGLGFGCIFWAIGKVLTEVGDGSWYAPTAGASPEQTREIGAWIAGFSEQIIQLGLVALLLWIVVAGVNWQIAHTASAFVAKTSTADADLGSSPDSA
ncbi:MAG: hypothetical protein WBA28_03885 [Microbacteriaceae bacterium]